MGFWGSLWDGIKSVGSSVYNMVRAPVDFIANAGNTIKKIPFIGPLASAFLTPITATAGAAQSGLNTVRDVASVGSALGLQHGGMVPQKKYYQA